MHSQMNIGSCLLQSKNYSSCLLRFITNMRQGQFQVNVSIAKEKMEQQTGKPMVAIFFPLNYRHASTK